MVIKFYYPELNRVVRMKILTNSIKKAKRTKNIFKTKDYGERMKELIKWAKLEEKRGKRCLNTITK